MVKPYCLNFKITTIITALAAIFSDVRIFFFFDFDVIFQHSGALKNREKDSENKTCV